MFLVMDGCCYTCLLGAAAEEAQLPGRSARTSEETRGLSMLTTRGVHSIVSKFLPLLPSSGGLSYFLFFLCFLYLFHNGVSTLGGSTFFYYLLYHSLHSSSCSLLPRGY
jgi:hypothetical protein